MRRYGVTHSPWAAGLIVFVLVSLIAPTHPALAALSIVVNSTSDAVDARPGDGVCRTSAGRCTLRAAIQETNARAGADTIRVPGGTFPLAIAPSNENLASNGDYDVTGSLTITGGGPGLTILDGGAPPAGSPPERRGLDRLFEIHPTAGSFTLAGLTLREGYSAESGGALHFASPGTLRLNDVHVLDSYAAKYGGGLNNAVGGQVELTGTRFSGNGAVEGGSAINNAASGSVAILAGSVVANPGSYPLGGGAIHNQAVNGAVGTIRIADSTIAENAARHPGAGIHNARDGRIVVERSTITGNRTTGDGGGIYTASGTVTVTASSIAANVAQDGGGIYHAGLLGVAGAYGQVVVAGSTIAGNSAASGGGIYNDHEGELVLTDVTLASNSATAEGGGVSSQNKTGLTVIRGSFVGNSAGEYGGGLVVETERATTINGTIFSDNAAGAGDAGGFYADGSGTVDVAGATFEHNSAGGAGGAIAIHSFGAFAIADSVVRNNTSASNGGGIENSGMGVSFTRLTISGNGAARDGGGIHNSSSGEFTIEDTTVEGNGAANGGGLANRPDSTLVVRRSRFMSNTARIGDVDSGLGGGIYSAGDGVASIEASVIAGNTAETSGGGIFHDADGALHIVNVTISTNSASNAGGGIFHDADGALQIINATIWQNAAPAGGAIGTLASDSAPTLPPTPDPRVILRNTIVGGSPRGASCNQAVTSEGGNLASDAICSLQGPRDRSNVNPIIEGLAENGGPTMTHALRANSLAVDGGVEPCPPTDQRGVARAQHIACDTGAVEFEGTLEHYDPTPPTTTIGTMPDALTTSTSATFTFSASEAGASFACSLDGSPFAACSSPITYSGLATGPHTFQVRAEDAAGNSDTTPASYVWTVEGPPPDCTLQITVPADADAWLEQNGPSSNKGDDSILKVKAQGPSDNFRALVGFTLPAAPEGCFVVSATLRLYAASATPGRTLQALRLAGDWSESGVTWGNQPATAGSAATASAASGYVEWNVADQVQAMYTAGAGDGFLIRDTTEGGVGGEQQFHSREKGEHPPLLVLSFGNEPLPPAVAEGYTPGEVLVNLRRHADLAAITREFGLAPAPLDQFGIRPIYLLAITDNTLPPDKAVALAADSRVLIAEPNYVGQTPEGIGRSSWAGGRSSWAGGRSSWAGGGSVGEYVGQWAPDMMRLSEAHAVSRGAGVTIAVLDTGVDGTHPALAGRLSRGFDFVDMDDDPREEGSRVDSSYGHGTHVAGLLALAAPDATIMPVRLLQADGSGNLWVTIEALQYAINPDGDMRTTNDAAHIINMSFSYLRQSQLLDQLVREATCDDDDLELDENLCDATGGRGVVFVAAAGNNGSSIPEYPAAEPVSAMLAVAASTAGDGLASFSNRGPWVHIAAPGEQIMSSVPGGDYGVWSGTSMAAPLVAGTVALVLAHDPELTASAAVSQVLNGAGPMNADVPWRIDAAVALGLPR